jgi:hypothetical protein
LSGADCVPPPAPPELNRWVPLNSIMRSKTYASLFGLACILLSSAYSSAQTRDTAPPQSISVESWKKGTASIAKQTFKLSLGWDQNEYELAVTDLSNRRNFRLRFHKDFVDTPRKQALPCWVTTFIEVRPDSQNGATIIGPNLLNMQGPGVGDYFPREDWAIYFCPIEKPQKLIDGSLYPIRAERKFLIENLFVSLRVFDYRVNTKENKLDSLRLNVGFGPR